MFRRVASVLIVMTGAVFLAPQPALGSAWENELAVIQDPVVQYDTHIAIEPDDTVHALWLDWTVWEDTKVMLTSSSDRGQTWTEPATIFEGVPYDRVEFLADEHGLHLLLVEFNEDEEEVTRLYYSKSVDGGETFSALVRIGRGDCIGDARLFPGADWACIFAANWDYESEVMYNYVYTSSDGGETWTEKPLLPDETVEHPAFAFRNGTIHVVFGKYLYDPGMSHSFSLDGGSTWSTPVRISQGAGAHSQLPQIAIDDEAIHVVWEDDRSDHFNILYSRSTDGGLTWSTDIQLNDTYYGARAKLLADEQGLHAVWCQYHGDDGWPSTWSSADYGIIWYKFSDDSGLTWSDEFRVSQNEYVDPIDLPDMGANYVELAEYGAGFCAMWRDKRDGNVDLYMRNNRGPCVGDIDGDGDTDLSDLAALLAAYGSSVGDPQYDPAADLDANGLIDLSDLAALLADYGCTP